MANYVDDFQSYTAGAGLPAGWTSRWDGGTWSIVDDAGDKFLRQVDTAPNRRLASWDAIDADADRAAVEVLAIVKTASVEAANAHMGVAARCSGTSTTETGYALVIFGDELAINRYSSGTNTQIGLTTTLSIAAGTKYNLRFRLNGTALKARIWAVGDSEPGTWALEVTDATITAAGWVGCFGFAWITGAPDDNHDFYQIAVATNGGTAAYSSPDGTATGGTGTGAGTGTGGTATGESPGVASGGTGTGTGSGTGGAATGGAMELQADYERSSVILSTSSISGVGDSAIISIRPKVQDSEAGNFHTTGEWLEPSVDVVGVNGYRPTFRFLNYFYGDTGMLGADASWSATRRPMYSYDDGLTWAYFDTAVVRDTTNNWIEFRNSTAFTANKVRIGRSRQMTVHQVGDWLAATAAAYSFFVPTASAAAYTPTGAVSDYAAQAFIADEFSTQVDSLGATVPVTPFYAAEINDTSLTPAGGGAKRVGVIAGGVHAGEDHASHVLKAFVAHLNGSSAAALALRAEYRIEIYACFNAPGKAGGGWRGSWTQGLAGADDANRHFSDTDSTLEIVDKPKAAITTDRAGSVPDWFVDFHGDWGGTWGVIAAAGNAPQARFISLLTTLGGVTVSDVGTPLAGFTTTYFESLGTKLAVTHEAGDTTPITDAEITTHGSAMVETLNAMMEEGAFFAIATGGTGAGTGAGTGGAAVGAGGGDATATGGTGSGGGSGTGGDASGQISAVAAGGTGTGSGAGVGGTGAGSGIYTRAPSGSGPSINQPNTKRPAQFGGLRY